MAQVPVLANRASLLVDLGDAQSFANEKSLGLKRIFGFTVTNASTYMQKVILNPSYTPSSPDRIIADGPINYIGHPSGGSDLTAASINQKSISDILAFLAQTPTRVLWMKVETNLTNQLSQQILITPKSIFSNPETETIDLGAFKDPKNPNDKLVNAYHPNLQFDSKTEVSVNIPAAVGGVATATTFTFYCGGTFDDGMVLYKAAMQANSGSF
ncbi:MAG: hypothetical protein JST29_05550 [Bacteroidetes bacterium]|nr:hypothetical protein [Bacteroidota bacterium]